MKCIACQEILDDYESVRKNKQGEYEDMCTKCLMSAGVDIFELDFPMEEPYDDPD